MNGRHLAAFVWLRWRVLMNQWRRAGRFNFVLLTIIVGAAIATAVPMFLGTFALAISLIPRARPAQLMLAMDVMLGGFSFFWLIGLAAELQRGDPINLSKFLHLPVSASGAFLINYLSSLARISLILFVPPLLGFSLALVYAQGISQILAPFGVLAFFLMITALTYQLQGWLAALMSNPRKRRAVGVFATLILVAISQTPNMINMMVQKAAMERQLLDNAQLQKDLAEIDRIPVKTAGDADERNRQRQVLLERRAQEQLAALGARQMEVENQASLFNMIIPLGWVAYGVKAAAENWFLPSALAFGGMAMIGIASLAKGYRATLAMYQGKASARRSIAAPAAARAARPTGKGAGMLEWRIPGTSEQVSAVACAGLRSLLRAPEAKLLLIGPLVMMIVLFQVFSSAAIKAPEALRPLFITGAIAFSIVTFVQYMGNLFGVDRDGFRVFVLSAASRRDILLGKNLIFVVPTSLVALLTTLVFEYFSPLRWDHLLAIVPLFVSFYLVYCTVMNFSSILTPMQITQASFKPTNPKASFVLIQFLLMLLVPALMALVAFPIAIEPVLNWLGWSYGLPIGLILSTVECLVIAVLYMVILGWQGRMLQAREMRILEVITGRAV